MPMTIKTLFVSAVLSSVAILTFAQSAPAVDGGNLYSQNQVAAPQRPVTKPANNKTKHQVKHATKKHHKANKAKKHKKQHVGRTAKAKGPGLQAY